MLANLHLREGDPEKAKPYAEIATNSNPQSAMARVLKGILPWRIKEKSTKPKPPSDEELGLWVNECEAALHLAQECCDETAEFVAMNALAYYLAMRFDRTANCKDLKRAFELCQYLETQYDWNRLHRQAAYLDTHGWVSMMDYMRTGNEDSLKMAKAKFEESAGINPYVPWPIYHLAELRKIAWARGIKL